MENVPLCGSPFQKLQNVQVNSPSANAMETALLAAVEKQTWTAPHCANANALSDKLSV